MIKMIIIELLVLVFTGIVISIVTSDINRDGGMCSLHSDDSKRRFPLDPPDRHIPWVWDAVLLQREKRVEVTVISRNACKFDHKMWKQVISSYPQYASQLGGGLVENIYVPVDKDFDYARPNSHLGGEIGKGLQGQFVLCVYLRNDVVVATLRSVRINDVEIAELSTLQIRCPLPDDSVYWNRIRLERYLSPEDGVSNNSTEPFEVCTTSASENVQQRYGTGKGSLYDYKLSVCTATSRASRMELVEWLEYHRLVGVEHFFMYDTSPWGTTKENELAYILSDYVSAGVVTVVRWPYENCVKNMGSGRWVNYIAQNDNKPGGIDNLFFRPPRAISQTAALASCYSRYKSSSKWMAHIDDDEFLSFSPRSKFSGRRVNDLVHLVEILSGRDSKLNAVYFKPLCVDDCNGVSEAKDLAFLHGSAVLPRLGKWNKGRFCPAWEGKLIMRTAAIGMFYTHYITLREKGPWQRNPLQLSYEQGATIHYKIANEVSGSVYGATIPIPLSDFPLSCLYRSRLKFDLNASLVLDDLTRISVPHVERRFISQLLESNV